MLAQKVMYEKFGDDFLVNFVSKGFSSAHCPPDQAEQYRQKLQVFKVYGAEMFIVYLSSPAEIIKKYWGRNIENKRTKKMSTKNWHKPSKH